MTPFNLRQWIDQHRSERRQPVCNRQVFEQGEFIIMVDGAQPSFFVATPPRASPCGSAVSPAASRTAPAATAPCIRWPRIATAPTPNASGTSRAIRSRWRA
ncbi:MAG: hypothetical protein KA506_08130 [Steroidobacteraceae bacterium]|nr:hypothetical protein [Steroidobacteraceae bacterium]